MTRKFANAVAAIFWFIITAIRITDLSPIGLFAAVQSGALVALLIVRAAPTRESPAHVKALASMATLAPFAMMPTSGGQIWIGMPMQLLGLVVAVWSMVALGRSFGVAPADRGLVVDRGPYRWVRHPMYASEIVALAGYLCGNPSIPNLFLFATITGVCIFRALAEEARIAGYADYTASVRWRMLPGVW